MWKVTCSPIFLRRWSRSHYIFLSQVLLQATSYLTWVGDISCRPLDHMQVLHSIYGAQQLEHELHVQTEWNWVNTQGCIHCVVTFLVARARTISSNQTTEVFLLSDWLIFPVASKLELSTPVIVCCTRCSPNYLIPLRPKSERTCMSFSTKDQRGSNLSMRGSQGGRFITTFTPWK